MSTRNPRLRPISECLFAALLFGASTPAAKLLVGPMGPVVLAGLLYLGAAAGTAPWALRNFAGLRSIGARNALWLGGAILFGGVLGPALLLAGLAAAPAASVALWLNMESVATTVLAWALFKEHVHRQTWLASLLVCLASVLLAAPSGFAFSLPALLVVLACVCWGLDNCFTSLIDGVTPAQTTFAKGLVAGCVNLALGLAVHGGQIAAPAVGGALLVGAGAYGWSTVLYISGAQQLGATRSQMIFATAPFWGVLIAWGVLAEPVGGFQLVAGGIMAIAIVLMQSEKHTHRHHHAQTHHTHLHRHDDGHHTHTHAGQPAWRWHSHAHGHGSITHEHPHQPDLHHRHTHPPAAR